ncbi:MAG: DUF2304 domain-containing protein [Nitrososphaerota archaeon]|nr:DUF2304 domain-containing protein [Nitrososphaerota archaeon]
MKAIFIGTALGIMGEIAGYLGYFIVSVIAFVFSFMFFAWITISTIMRARREQSQQNLTSRELALLRAEPVQTYSQGDTVYEKLRPKLEKESFGKIVAIDVSKGDVAGVGDTVEEAYENARSNRPEVVQFHFRRVGNSFVDSFG